MADIQLDTQSVATTPASGKAILAVNNTTKRLQLVNDAGLKSSFGFVNFSTALQSPSATVRTYLTGSNITIPAGALQIGTIFRWTLSMTKDANGSAASTFDICFGTTGTTSDTARVSFTKAAGTAAADEATINIVAICRGPISNSGVVAGNFCLTHNLQSTGHAAIAGQSVTTISSGFDVTAPTNIGVCVTSGASDALTFQLVLAEVFNV